MGHVLSLGIWKIMLGLGRTLAVAAGVDFGAQWVMWGYSAAKETEHYYDLTGSLTFGTLTLTALALNHGTGALPPLRAALAGGWCCRGLRGWGRFCFHGSRPMGRTRGLTGRGTTHRGSLSTGPSRACGSSPRSLLSSSWPACRGLLRQQPLFPPSGSQAECWPWPAWPSRQPQTRKSRPSRRSTPRSLSTPVCGRSPAIQTTWARSCFGQACTASAPQASQPSLPWLPSPLPFPLPLSPTCSSTSVAFLLSRGRPTKSTEMIPSTSGMSRPPLFWFPAGTGPRSTACRYRPPPGAERSDRYRPPGAERSGAELGGSVLVGQSVICST